jgi:hypothetical protein
LRDTQAGPSLFDSPDHFLLTVPFEMIVALLLAALFTGERLKNSSDGAARNVVRVRYVGRVETPLFV